MQKAAAQTIINTPLQMVQSLTEYKGMRDTLLSFSRASSSFTKPPCFAAGLSEGLRDALCASVVYDKELFEGRNGNNVSLVICPDEKCVYAMEKALRAYGLNVGVFPLRDYNFHNISASSRDWEYERLKVLREIAEGALDAVITVPDAALGILPSPSALGEESVFEVGKEADPTKICALLDSLGYIRADFIEGKGQYSYHNDILEVFLPEHDYPVRAEFFGDEIDAAGFFDTLTQRRIQNVQSFSITRIKEVSPSEESLKLIGETMERLISVADAKKNKAVKEKLQKEQLDLANGNLVNIDKYLNKIYTEFHCLFDYAGGSVFVADYPRVRDRLKASLWQLNQDLTSLAENGEADIKDAVYILDNESFKAKLFNRPCVITDAFSSAPDMKISGLFEFSSKHTSMSKENLEILCEDLEDYTKSKYKILVAVRSQLSAKELCDLLEDKGFKCAVTGSIAFDQMVPSFIYIMPKEDNGGVLSGFECPKAAFVLLSDSDDRSLSGARKRGEIKKAKHKSAGKRILSYLELTVGDFVVHDIHGIGVYEGIKTLTAAGVTRDYITLKYAGGDSLYVPCDQLDKVSKFSGKSDTVRLSKMGGAEWKKTKTRVKQAAKDMAKKLIALYAERSRRPGYAFGPDSDWQREFEDRFEYEETDGQLESIREIKRDMEKPCPMDRLLCGDVGFGKTEVALRAIFKCVNDGKQAAILVPTTVLCWQHFKTTLSRMHGFPIRVEMLSRYVSAKKAKEVLAGLKSGEVDIVVGTHKILAKNVEFKNLGLLVVDEEQRFGVAHKERLKEMAKQVDVLTLTATPIPRTFNMALAGIRDMSVLEEAPVNRHPVQTYVLEHDMFIIGEAIKKELRRAGQVFYIHNRVEDINETAAKIREMVPDANIAAAHGKMSQEELSEVWRDVVDGKIDVLVCTTIIETGVDVPNANTLIIEDADRMGLSQLHQIRGRVGRSSRRAYAYFTWRKASALSEIAEKRLCAIKEFTEFGSGFKIAMRDLEIRGAGNLLGAEQSGHMEAVGYDLFVKLLEKAVLEEKGEAAEEKAECTVDLKVSAYIPEKYIKRPAGRIEMYKKIAAVESKEDADDIIDEMLDRYGEIPKETRALINVALIRVRCEKLGLVKVEQKDGKLVIYPRESPDREKAFAIASKFAGRVLLCTGKEPCFNIRLRTGEDITPVLEEIFKIYSQSVQV